ncbi:hypothetical protein GCAAIG_05495 [Candidatus Electronema halotolerans]
MKKRLFFICCILLASAGILTAACASSSRLPARKKLIKYGQDRPTPSDAAAHIREMEKRPFDGIVMTLTGKNKGNIFRGGKWDAADYAADMEALKKIKWGTFTDNFLIMNAASAMDWFSDQDWDNIVSNVEIMATAAKAGRCNLAFDPEPYGKNPWHYKVQAHAKEKSFGDYEAKVRQRGAQFIEAIQKHLPETVLLTLFSYSIFPNITDQPTAAKRTQMIGQQELYGLYPAFLSGILDAMGPGITVIDGNEPSYYYPDTHSFYTGYHLMRQTALGLVPPEDTDTFLLQTQAGHALYFDYIFGTVKWKNILAQFMTEKERLKWWEHNVYWALKTTDEYVWLWNERMNWWKEEGMPPGMEQALISAREKIAQQKPLGFEIDEFMDRAQKAKAAAKEKELLENAED